MEGSARSPWKEGLISWLAQGLARNSFQKRPYFPDLLKQPDLLIVPQIGRLIAVFAYRYRVSWPTVLASLEDLFETKLHVGEHTVVAAFLVPKSNGPVRDAIQLLENTFDLFRTIDQEGHPPTGREAVPLERTIPKTILKDFLAHEREQIRRYLAHFSETRYRPLVQKDHTSEYQGAEFEETISRRVREVLGLTGLVREPLIQNVKGYLADLHHRYSFEFDLGIPGHPDRVIEIIRSGRYASRERVRYLMTKGRLLRYEVVDNRLQPRLRDFRPILIVDGNIAGPDHDPYRYVRALVSVGWEILRADHLEELPGIIHHADFQS